jgi:hypothetical protein
MGTVFIMIIFSHVQLGTVVTTQEFNSQTQCEYVASQIRKTEYINAVWCMQK